MSETPEPEDIGTEIAKQAQILKTGAIPYRIPTEPTELPGALGPGKVTADPAHVNPDEDGWFSSPGSDILRRPVYNDKGEFVGYQEMLPSIWAKPPMTDELKRWYASSPRRIDKIDPETVERINEAVAKFGEAMKPFGEALREGFSTFARIIAEHPEWFDDKPIHPKDVRDERGIKKPSNVVPMWADQPNKRRKR